MAYKVSIQGWSNVYLGFVLVLFRTGLMFVADYFKFFGGLSRVGLVFLGFRSRLCGLGFVWDLLGHGLLFIYLVLV